MDYKNEIARLRSEFKEYALDSRLQSVVLGMSGGADSALVAALVRPICDEINIPLITRSITIETNKQDEINRSYKMGEHFSTDFNHIDITNEYFIMRTMLEKDDSDIKDETDIQTKIRLGNVKARMRMIKLYDLAQKNNGMVLSTDNKTEYLLGFWTIQGDVGDYEMIHHLWKTEVFEMMQWIVDNELTDQDKKDALQACIDCVPTDGLGITANGDLDQLEADSYEEVDIVLKKYFDTGEVLNEKVITRHLNSRFKRLLPIRPPKAKQQHLK